MVDADLKQAASMLRFLQLALKGSGIMPRESEQCERSESGVTGVAVAPRQMTSHDNMFSIRMASRVKPIPDSVV